MFFQIYRRRNIGKYEIMISDHAADLTEFGVGRAKLLAKPFVLDFQLPLVMTSALATLRAPTTEVRRDRNKEACEEQACGKRQNEGNDSLKKPGVIHIAHLLYDFRYYLRRFIQSGFTGAAVLS